MLRFICSRNYKHKIRKKPGRFIVVDGGDRVLVVLLEKACTIISESAPTLFTRKDGEPRRMAMYEKQEIMHAYINDYLIDNTVVYLASDFRLRNQEIFY